MLLFQYPDLRWEQASIIKPYFSCNFWKNIIFLTLAKNYFSNYISFLCWLPLQVCRFVGQVRFWKDYTCIQSLKYIQEVLHIFHLKCHPILQAVQDLHHEVRHFLFLHFHQSAIMKVYLLNVFEYIHIYCHRVVQSSILTSHLAPESSGELKKIVMPQRFWFVWSGMVFRNP